MGDGLVAQSSVEKVVQIFKSFQEADEADALRDAGLSPEERLRILIELRDRAHPDAAEQGLARVCRVTKLERS
jgi:flagellar motility protein MotE (MotC chaperone)